MTQFRTLASGHICCCSYDDTGKRIEPNHPCDPCKEFFADPPNGYEAGIEALQAAMATPESRFAEGYTADRLRALAEEQVGIDGHVDATPRLTAAELAEWDPPDPWSAALTALQQKERAR